MIDSLIFSNDIRSTTSFLIKSENVLVYDNEFSEAGLLENIAQTAAAHAAFEKYKKGLKPLKGFICAIKNFEVFALPVCGEVIQTQIKLENDFFDFTTISGQISRNSVILAKCEMKILIHTLE